jgi:hypothetical protein
MRPARALAWLWLLASALPAHAQHEGAIAAGVTAGTLHAPVPAEPGPPGRALAEFADRRSGLATRTAIGCGGIAVEAVLSGTSNHNFVTVIVHNESGEPVTFLPRNSRARFGKRGPRQLLDGGSDAKLDSGWYVTRSLRFADKAEFEDQERLEVELRLMNEYDQLCTLPVIFERDPAIEPSERTHVSFTVLEVELGLGARIFESGGVRDLGGGSGVAFHLDFSGFFGVHHGMTVSIPGDFHGDDAVERVAPELELAGHPRISGVGFLVGYIGRLYLTPWLNVAYNAATGPYLYELLDDSEGGARLDTAVLPLRHRLRLALDMITMGDGSRFSFAASFTHLWIPHGDFGTVELKGHALAATLALMVGI